jgi:uncharacterized membrane protein
MSISIKDTVQKIIGYILAAPGLLLFFIGIAMVIDPNEGEGTGTGVAIAVVALAFFIPGLFFIWNGRKLSEEEEFVESISAIVMSTRRITLVDIADKLDTSVPKARKALLKAINLKLISGNFDRTTGEFFTEEGKNTQLVFKFCPNCGAPFNKTFLEGETIKCESCGAIIR